VYRIGTTFADLGSGSSARTPGVPSSFDDDRSAAWARPGFLGRSAKEVAKALGHGGKIFGAVDEP
jgi:hypothetical protein